MVFQIHRLFSIALAIHFPPSQQIGKWCWSQGELWAWRLATGSATRRDLSSTCMHSHTNMLKHLLSEQIQFIFRCIAWHFEDFVSEVTCRSSSIGYGWAIGLGLVVMFQQTCANEHNTDCGGVPTDFQYLFSISYISSHLRVVVAPAACTAIPCHVKDRSLSWTGWLRGVSGKSCREKGEAREAGFFV